MATTGAPRSSRALGASETETETGDGARALGADDAAPGPSPDETGEVLAAVEEQKPRHRIAVLRWQFAWLWWIPLIAAVTEVLSFVASQSRVVPDEDWQAAGEYVRERFEERDAVAAAPEWADPLMRRELGDLMTVADVGRSDTARYERLWALTIRGHEPAEAPRREPAIDEDFGRVRVRMWELGPSLVLYDFVEHIRDAEVTLRKDGQWLQCPWRRTGFPYAGGLNSGALWPDERFVCPAADWLWVGPTVQEDLHLQNHYCVWQHPPGGDDPMRSTFRDVPLGERVVLYAGIFYGNENTLDHGPVHVTVKVGEEQVGRLTHNDGDGWKRMEVWTRTPVEARRDPEARGDVSIEVTAPNPHVRTLCWAAAVERGTREP
jgi:hypothetical protein